MRTIVESRRKWERVHLAQGRIGKPLVVIAEAHAAQTGKPVDDLVSFAVVEENTPAVGDHRGTRLGMLAQVRLGMHVVGDILCDRTLRVDVHFGSPTEFGSLISQPA